MNVFKKSLFIALTLFLTIEISTGQTKKLRPKLRRPQKANIATILKVDDKAKVEKAVAAINAQTQTAQEKVEIKKALQTEIIKETQEIKQELAKAQNDHSQYINYGQALEIIKSKKELSKMRGSSWTTSAIIKPFTQTYRLFLRWWNQKEYVTMLEKERKSLEHELNVQAHNNLMLLYVALDLKIKQAAAYDIEHMFKKDNFYNITTHAFEGGAIFAGSIELSKELSKMFVNLSRLITNNFNTIRSNAAVVQSIYAMNEIIWSSEQLREGYRIKRGLEKDIHYESSRIRDLCIKAAETNKQVLHSNKKTYPQYLKDWISEPKNVATAGLVLGAIGGLYIFGPAVPAWLKEYTNKSVTSLVESVKSGTTTMINSVKNLWNKVRGNKELPDSRESRMEAQEQELKTDKYFVNLGNDRAEIHQNLLNTPDELLQAKELEARRDIKHLQMYPEFKSNIKQFEDVRDIANEIKNERTEAQILKNEQENAEVFEGYHQPITQQEQEEHPAEQMERKYIATLDPDLQEHAEFIQSSLPNPGQMLDKDVEEIRKANTWVDEEQTRRNVERKANEEDAFGEQQRAGQMLNDIEGQEIDDEIDRFNTEQAEVREQKERRLSQLSSLKEEQDREFVQEQRKQELQLQKEIQLKDKLERELQERNAAADRAKAEQAETIEKLNYAKERIESGNQNLEAFTKQLADFDEDSKKYKQLFDKKHWKDGIKNIKETISFWEKLKKDSEEKLDDLSKVIK